MILIFLGPPACGKGTQAQRLAENEGLVQIATGDLLREAVSKGTDVGKEAQGYMNSGGLVPDEIVIKIFADALKERVASGQKGFILDGFPRTVPQGEALKPALAEQGLDISAVLEFTLTDEELVRRATGRRLCSNKSCQAPYHVHFKKPQNDGVCDKCGSELYQRDDDKEETVRARIAEYEAKTAPLRDFYSREGKLVSIDANRDIDTIAGDVSGRVKELKS